ncbi:MAG: hypothetical protein K2J04_06115 [Lachnospiraceae bacterium]|nr:hypothetical protein [Lachnospiraceae bacterium]
MRLDYSKEKFTKVRVCGVECEFSDMRIDRSTVPQGKYQYEVAGDDDSGSDPARVQRGVLVNFFGTLISDMPLLLVNDNVVWLQEGNFEWL